MLKRYFFPVLYCGFLPLVIGFTLFISPELSLTVVQNSTPLARLARTLMALWLILGYVGTGVSFIPNFESSSIGILIGWGKYPYLRDENQKPIYDRSTFPFVYFFSAFIVSSFTSFVLLMAISTFEKISILTSAGIALVNFILLFLPQVLLYKNALQSLYGSEYGSEFF